MKQREGMNRPDLGGISNKGKGKGKNRRNSLLSHEGARSGMKGRDLARRGFMSLSTRSLEIMFSPHGATQKMGLSEQPSKCDFYMLPGTLQSDPFTP